MSIDNRNDCLKALRKLGYKKCQMQLTRVAKTYSPGGEMGARPLISVGAKTVMVTHPRYFFSPNLIHVKNLQGGVAESIALLTSNLRERGHLVGDDGSPFDIAVAIARAAKEDEDAPVVPT